MVSYRSSNLYEFGTLRYLSGNGADRFGQYKRNGRGGPVTVVIGIFSLGAVLPLIGIGLVSQQRFRKVRGGLQGAARAGKRFLGAGLLAVSFLVLTGLDKTVERWLLNVGPGWLLELTTRF